MNTLRVAMAQLPLVIACPEQAARQVVTAAERAEAAGAALLITPELYLSGYPADDLLLHDDFLSRCDHALDLIAARTARLHVAVLVGAPRHGGNEAVLVHRGRVRGAVRKQQLPTYGPFDEARYFRAAADDSAGVVLFDDLPVGVTICEDLWVPDGPHDLLGAAGVGLIVNLSASPYHRGKLAAREALLGGRSRDWACGIAYCNLVGAHDELVFDGASMLVGPDGAVLARAAQFTEELLIVDVPLAAWTRARERDIRLRRIPMSPIEPIARIRTMPAAKPPLPAQIAAPLHPMREVWEALTMSLRDYVRRARFERVVFGMSGGIDSALVALLSVDALGPRRVDCLVMPSPFSTSGTQGDAHRLADALGITHDEIGIADMMTGVETGLAPIFAREGRLERDVTEENIQARLRAVLLLAYSNKLNALLISTGNKTEVAVGYSTYMGDAAGGISLIRSIGKLLVFDLCRWRIAQGDLSDEAVETMRSILERPPSAELAEGQRDSDTLPPYEILDPIVEAYVETGMGIEEIAAIQGADVDLVGRIAAMIDRAEFKRRQSPPGPKITTRDWGRDRRMPITRDHLG